VFHPALNACGGAEFVSINIINTLKQHGHNIVVLTDEKINRAKIEKIYDVNLIVDSQIIFPFALFPPTDYHNIYSDIIRCRLLKQKCDILIDAYSNDLLPGADIAYIHYPLLKRIPSNFRNEFYYWPYRVISEKTKICTNKYLDTSCKAVLANSKFTAKAIKEVKNVDAPVLYPPISHSHFGHPKSVFTATRENLVVTVSRISEEKKLENIPYIAKLTNKKIKFLIIGLPASETALRSLLESIRKCKVSDRVKILTYASRDRLNEILLSSKVYLHSAINEHFGISIAEAMASGCIPVVHDSGGPREFVSQDLRYETLEEAAEKVDRSIFEWSPQNAMNIANSATRFHEKTFSEEFMKIFERVTN